MSTIVTLNTANEIENAEIHMLSSRLSATTSNKWKSNASTNEKSSGVPLPFHQK